MLPPGWYDASRFFVCPQQCRYRLLAPVTNCPRQGIVFIAVLYVQAFLYGIQYMGTMPGYGCILP